MASGGSTARKGVVKLLSATKSSVSALSKGISKARKDYANKHEDDVLADIRQTGVSVVDLVFQALRRIYFLYMAGYKSELVAAAVEAGKRLTEADSSSVPLDAVMVFENTLREEARKYGNFDKENSISIQSFVNRSRAGKEHSDRTSVAHDIYYAVLATARAYGSEWDKVEQVFRDASSRVIGNAIHATDDTKDARSKAAKALFIFGCEIKAKVEEASSRRQKVVRDAENVLRKEQERLQKLSV
ncbi:uncharacterized protein LOC112346144 [Selaginella moellendorffii]|uniref:uncharacterized protein LOC112346144 n=1 Tax=Selaginella moellendorffii TaxID=88036 RepID=UPI000D1C21EE|nr:uncharacterized protein LOC112346144 [Selaginella moellendorffii]|eukprot:XP_024530149.1 uncharacterized protein LOC112346144 [Selaginella moellendorffii]